MSYLIIIIILKGNDSSKTLFHAVTVTFLSEYAVHMRAEP